MNEIQQAAYVIAQAACAMCEVEAMKADNERCRQQGVSDAYGESHFMALQDKYGIHHNAVITLFQG